MTQNSFPWDGISVGDAATAPYSSNEWAHLWALLNGAGSRFGNYGVLLGSGDASYDPLQVIASGGSNVDVKVGAALVNGKLYENDAAVTLAVGANASGNPRIDTVILRVDYTAQTVRALIKQGTPAGSPARPTLTQNTTLWEMPLADIAVANGFSSITQTVIKDRRRVPGQSGAHWQPFAYPLYYIPAGAYNSNLQSLQSFVVPFVLSGNMQVDSVSFQPGSTAASRGCDWGIYAQDLNDEGSNEDILRLIGGRVNAGLTNFVSGTVSVITAPQPFYLAPGSYWLAIYFDGNLSVPSIAPTTLDANTNKALISTVFAPITQTIDANSPYSKSPLSFGIRLNGRVNGELAGF